MLEKAIEGFMGALIGAIMDLIVYAVLKTTLTPIYFLLMQLIFLAASVAQLESIKYWGTGYMLGWLAAIWFLTYAGLSEVWLTALYSIICLILIIHRFAG